ncbi:competence type IV pilus major pilin ComGC [Candidatus Auribacterota bacterium]
MKHNGFTLVELMIGVSIMALLAIIAIPNVIQSREIARMNACMNNLRIIEHATEQAGMELNTPQWQRPAAVTVNSYIKGGAPSCPSDGTYEYSFVGTEAACRYHGSISQPYYRRGGGCVAG